MSQGLVFRPKAEKRKIHSKNEFELCYIRHQYFRKTDHNPSEEEMRPYKEIVKHMGKNTYFTYKNLFHMIGFESEDLINIAMIHLVSFLGLFSLEKMPEKYEEFISAHTLKFNKIPQKEDKLSKNKANCTMFLKQRMEDVVRVCRQKARNIKGLPTEEYFFYYGPKKPPKILRDLVDNHEKYGYRKLDTAVFKSIKKRIHTDDSPVFRLNDQYYVAVPVEQKILSLSDFSGAGLDPHDSIHNKNPEEMLFAQEDNKFWEKKHREFTRKNKVSKANMVKKFIEENKKRPEFKEEVKIARRFLKNIGA